MYFFSSVARVFDVRSRLKIKMEKIQVPRWDDLNVGRFFSALRFFIYNPIMGLFGHNFVSFFS